MSGLLFWTADLRRAHDINRSHYLFALRSTDVVASAIMPHNVVDMTDIIKNLVFEGYPVTQKHIACLNPYAREHIRRFGQYVLKNGKGTRTPEITYIATDAMIVGRYDNFLHVSCTYPRFVQPITLR